MKKKKLFFLRRLRCLNYWKIEFSFGRKMHRGKSFPKITSSGVAVTGAPGTMETGQQQPYGMIRTRPAFGELGSGKP